MFGERRGPSFTRSEGGECDGVTDTPPRPSDEGSAPERMPPWLPRAVALVFAAVVLFFLGWWVLRELRSLLIMIFVALFLSLAMEPAVTRLARRGWRRGPATGLVLGGVIVVGDRVHGGGGVGGRRAGVGPRRRRAAVRPRLRTLRERRPRHRLGRRQSLVRELRSGDGARRPHDDIVSNALDARRRDRGRVARVRHRADLRVLHDGRRPAHAPRRSARGSHAGTSRWCSTRGRSRSTRPAATSTRAASRR